VKRLAAILAGLVLVVVAIGLSLPREHTVRRTIHLGRPPAEVFAVLADVRHYPDWRSDVKAVESLGETGWKEIGADGTIPYELVESVPPSRRVTRIADPELPFGGSWTCTIEPTADGSTVTITEDGEVKNPLFRFVSRFVLGHAATVDQYLKALGARFGEDVAPE
jgi:uncharacterized protein YndB with AHSA1/START domain